MMPTPPPAMNHALTHNAFTMLTQAYGQMLVDLDKQMEFLRAMLQEQTQARQRAESELASLRTRLGITSEQEPTSRGR